MSYFFAQPALSSFRSARTPPQAGCVLHHGEPAFGLLLAAPLPERARTASLPSPAPRWWGCRERPPELKVNLTVAPQPLELSVDQLEALRSFQGWLHQHVWAGPNEGTGSDACEDASNSHRDTQIFAGQHAIKAHP